MFTYFCYITCTLATYIYLFILFCICVLLFFLYVRLLIVVNLVMKATRWFLEITVEWVVVILTLKVYTAFASFFSFFFLAALAFFSVSYMYCETVS